MALVKEEKIARIDVMWKAYKDVGLEHLSITEDNDGITASSVILEMNGDRPVRILYNICFNSDWKVKKFYVEIFDDKYESTILKSDCSGNWETDVGKPIESLEGCIDIDISATPFTNTIPIRRLSLKPGESREIKVVYVDIYNHSLRPGNQRYTCLESNLDNCKYRYENIDSGFMAEFLVDRNGFVIDYPDLFKRVCSKEWQP